MLRSKEKRRTDHNFTALAALISLRFHAGWWRRKGERERDVRGRKGERCSGSIWTVEDFPFAFTSPKNKVASLRSLRRSFVLVVRVPVPVLLTRVLLRVPCFGPRSLCALLLHDKLLPASPSLSDRKSPRGPLAGDTALPRTLGNEWAAAGRESGLGLCSPPPPYYYHSSSSSSTTVVQPWVNMSPSCDFYT